MPRKLRLEYPGARYHVINRGNYRSDVFAGDGAKQAFERALFEGCLKWRWQLHAFTLMRNHFHLVVETPNANLVAGMAWLLSTYTIRLNHRHKLSGHVFAGRYKALVVDGSGDGWATLGSSAGEHDVSCSPRRDMLGAGVSQIREVDTVE